LESGHESSDRSLVLGQDEEAQLPPMPQSSGTCGSVEPKTSRSGPVQRGGRQGDGGEGWRKAEEGG
jgi:hypothetical protein